MKVTKVLDAIREELSKPLPEPRVIPSKKERKMAKKSKKQVEDEERDDEDEGDEEEEAPKAKKSKKDKAAKSSKKSAKKSSKSDDDSGYVSIGDLAEEAEIAPQSARVKLRDSDIEKPEGGRWRWREGSKDLKAVRKVLGL